MTPSSVFSLKSFQNPDNYFRPLQIIHGMDRVFPKKEGAAPTEAAWQVERLPLPETKPLDDFLEKLVRLGTGGIVTNVGFQDYLISQRQWDILRYGIQKAADLGLRIWLYDEEGYPSGTAGGYVTRGNPENLVLGLACYSKVLQGPANIISRCRTAAAASSGPARCRSCNRDPPADFIDLSGQLDAWQVLQWDVPEGEWTVMLMAERIMYEGTHSCNNVHALKPYINVLDPQPVQRFIELTHAAYARQLPPELWQKVDAIFTDEPSFMTQYLPGVAGIYPGKVPVVDQPLFSDRPPAVPWHANLPAQFQALVDYDLLPYVYAAFCSESDEACFIRQAYYSVITRLYTEAFFVQIQDWCHAHRIASSGHVLLEETLVDHVGFSGSLMALLRRMDLPGIDMLNSDPQEMLHRGSFMGESWLAAKVASSAAHLAGTARIHSESSDWEQHNKGRFASLAERQGQGNLQYVMGINTLTSYFGWHELGEDAQRQYHDLHGPVGLAANRWKPHLRRGGAVPDSQHVGALPAAGRPTSELA